MKSSTSQNQLDPDKLDPAELFTQLGSAVYGYALFMLKNPVDAQDILSDTFLRICRKKEQYKSHGNVRAWVLSIARHLCIDLVRSRARRARTESISWPLPGSQPSPSTLSEKRERREIILTAIDKLSVEQKDVVMLKIHGGLTFQEISQTLGIPLNTALGRMHQALIHLRRNPALAKIGIPENGL